MDPAASQARKDKLEIATINGEGALGMFIIGVSLMFAKAV